MNPKYYKKPASEHLLSWHVTFSQEIQLLFFVRRKFVAETCSKGLSRFKQAYRSIFEGQGVMRSGVT